MIYRILLAIWLLFLTAAPVTAVYAQKSKYKYSGVPLDIKLGGLFSADDSSFALFEVGGDYNIPLKGKMLMEMSGFLAMTSHSIGLDLGSGVRYRFANLSLPIIPYLRGNVSTIFLKGRGIFNFLLCPKGGGGITFPVEDNVGFGMELTLDLLFHISPKAYFAPGMSFMVFWEFMNF